MIDLPDTIVDAHHHLWNPATGVPDVGYVWLRAIGAAKPFGDPTPIQRDYLLDEFRTEPGPARIVASVHVQADDAIADPVAETRFIQTISNAAGFPIAIVGFVDLAGDAAEETLRRHKAHAGFRGVRQILSRLGDRPDLSFAPEHYLDNERWRAQFGLLAEHGLSFDLQLYPEQMHAAAEFLARHPQVPVVIDHAGSPYDQSTDGLAVWRDGMAALASLPNTSVKLSGFGMFDAGWTAVSVRPLVDTLNELFGYDRILFGSNFPVDKLMRTYPDILADIASLYADQPTAVWEAVFSNNARRVYRI